MRAARSTDWIVPRRGASPVNDHRPAIARAPRTGTPSRSPPDPDARRCAARGTTPAPCAPASARWREPHRGLLGRLARGRRTVTSRPQLPFERCERRRVRVDDRLVALLCRAEPLDAVQPGPQCRQQVLGIELAGVAERLTRPAQAGAEQRPGRAAHAVDQRSADPDQELAGGQIGGGIEVGDGRREPAVHVDAVVGVADRRVELREEVAVRRDLVGAPAHPPADRGVVVHVEHPPGPVIWSLCQRRHHRTAP